MTFFFDSGRAVGEEAWTPLLQSARSAVEGHWGATRRQLEKVPAEKRTAEIFASLGLAHLALGELDSGHLELQRALKAEPTFAEARYWLGVAALRAGKIKQANEALDTAVSLRPDRPDYKLGRALARAAAGKVASGVEDIIAAARLEPNLLTPTYHPDERRGVLRCLERGLQDYPDRESVEDTLVHLLRGAELWLEAEKRAVKRQTAAAFEVRGRIALSRGDVGEALRLLELALSKQPGSPNALFHLARAAYLNHEPERARVALRKATELRPADPRIQAALATLYLDQGDLERAELSFGYALARMRTATVLSGYGRVRELQGDHDGALRHYRAALSLAPGEAQTLARLAGLLERTSESRAEAKSLRKRLKATEQLERDFADALEEAKKTTSAHSETCALIKGEPAKALDALRSGGKSRAAIYFARSAAADRTGDRKSATQNARALLVALSARDWSQGRRPAVVLQRKIGPARVIRYTPILYIPAENLP
jgi:tetratricopeptide (TPR) repeat protein